MQGVNVSSSAEAFELKSLLGFPSFHFAQKSPDAPFVSSPIALQSSELLFNVSKSTSSKSDSTRKRIEPHEWRRYCEINYNVESRIYPACPKSRLHFLHKSFLRQFRWNGNRVRLLSYPKELFFTYFPSLNRLQLLWRIRRWLGLRLSRSAMYLEQFDQKEYHQRRDSFNRRDSETLSKDWKNPTTWNRNSQMDRTSRCWCLLETLSPTEGTSCWFRISQNRQSSGDFLGKTEKPMKYPLNGFWIISRQSKLRVCCDRNWFQVMIDDSIYAYNLLGIRQLNTGVIQLLLFDPHTPQAWTEEELALKTSPFVNWHDWGTIFRTPQQDWMMLCPLIESTSTNDPKTPEM